MGGTIRISVYLFGRGLFSKLYVLLNQRYLHPIVYFAAMLLLAIDIVVTILTLPEVFQHFAFYSFMFSFVVISNFAYGFYLILKHKEP